MKEGVTRQRDRDAQDHNIAAGKAVASAVRSTLGPKGMDKMLVGAGSQITITNDGATLLDDMRIENPTGKMLIEVAESQEEEAGDGTTTAVVLTGELLEQAEDLLEQDIHPSSIIRGYRLASREIPSIIDDLAIDIDPTDEDVLRRVAETSMTGKGAEQHKEFLADIIVDTVSHLIESTDDGVQVRRSEFDTTPTNPETLQNSIETETFVGAPITESEVLFGAMITNKDKGHEDMPDGFDDAKVLVTSDAIELGETEPDAKVTVNTPAERQALIESERQAYRKMIDGIVESGANVVVAQSGIDKQARRLFAREGILALQRVNKGTINTLADIMQCPVVADVDSFTPDDLGSASFQYDEGDDAFYVTDVEDPKAVTIILRGSTEQLLDEIERGVEDAMRSVFLAVEQGRVLAGGGAPEVAIAARLREYGQGVSGREQLAVEAYADAVEVIPKILAENAGLDGIDILVELRAAHEDGNVRSGLDVESGGVVDTHEAGVLESVRGKKNAFTAATEAANMILKIDDIINASDLSDDDEEEDGPPGGAGGMPGGAGGMPGGMM